MIFQIISICRRNESIAIRFSHYGLLHTSIYIKTLKNPYLSFGDCDKLRFKLMIKSTFVNAIVTFNIMYL